MIIPLTFVALFLVNSGGSLSTIQPWIGIKEIGSQMRWEIREKGCGRVRYDISLCIRVALTFLRDL